MNPGPFGMAQTGIPFGEVNLARDWLGLEGKVSRPSKEHPKRPILGFECTRSEVSGARLWGWAKERYGSPEKFFKGHFVVNYCPLVFLEESGRNRTPDKLKAAERASLFDLCDEALRDIVKATGAKGVVGIGRFARDRAGAALEGQPVKVGTMLHPSPANPAANKGWAQAADRALEEIRAGL
jgi:single-strand selective monofunctional uracil DNA glycosylase